MIKRLTSLSLIFVSIGLVCTLVNVPSVLGTENPLEYRLAQSGTNEITAEEIRTTGKLILGIDGQIYVVINRGGESFKSALPFFIGQEARGLTQAEAEATLIQSLSIGAWDAMLRCLEAREKAKKNEMSEEEANLVCADAREKNALLDQATASIMLLNPFVDQLEWEEKLFKAEQELQEAAIDMQAAIDAGAEPFTEETFTVGIPDLDPPQVPTETTWQRLPLPEPPEPTSPSLATAEGS